MRTGHGTKGSRQYDWAMLEVTSDDAPGDRPAQRDAGRSVLRVRRHRYTGTCSFYRCWTPGPVPLTRLIAIAVTRWRIDWSALCLLAYIYLAVAAASHRDRRPGLETGLIPLTIPELVRLLRDTVIPPLCRDQAHRQHWSRWRRRHQYRAGQAHRRWHAYADATP
jgi:hypothetical protein